MVVPLGLLAGHLVASASSPGWQVHALFLAVYLVGVACTRGL